MISRAFDLLEPLFEEHIISEHGQVAAEPHPSPTHLTEQPPPRTLPHHISGSRPGG